MTTATTTMMVVLSTLNMLISYDWDLTASQYICWCHYSDVIWKCNDVSNHQQLDCLLNSLLRLASKKIKELLNCFFVRAIYRRPAVSPHEGQWCRKQFPCRSVIIVHFTASETSPEDRLYRADPRLRPANERRRHIVTSSLIGWAQA